MYDPNFVTFCQWLVSRSTDSIAGPLARHLLANGFLPGVLDKDANFTPTIVEHNGASMSHPGATYTAAPLAWASAPAAAAAQALRWHTFDGLHISVRHFGPNCSLDQYSAALAAWGG